MNDNLIKFYPYLMFVIILQTILAFIATFTAADYTQDYVTYSWVLTSACFLCIGLCQISFKPIKEGKDDKSGLMILGIAGLTIGVIGSFISLGNIYEYFDRLKRDYLLFFTLIPSLLALAWGIILTINASPKKLPPK